jgi:hypothetical protein
MLSDRYYMREDYRPERTSFLIWLLCAIVAGFVIQNVFAVWLHRADFEAAGRAVACALRQRLCLDAPFISAAPGQYSAAHHGRARAVLSWARTASRVRRPPSGAR